MKVEKSEGLWKKKIGFIGKFKNMVFGKKIAEGEAVGTPSWPPLETLISEMKSAGESAETARRETQAEETPEAGEDQPQESQTREISNEDLLTTRAANWFKKIFSKEKKEIISEEELNKEIKNARFEDLGGVVNSIEKQFPELNLENSDIKSEIMKTLKDLGDGNYEKVKRYSEKSIETMQQMEGDISGKKELISFFERMRDIAGEMERESEETEGAVDMKKLKDFNALFNKEELKKLEEVKKPSDLKHAIKLLEKSGTQGLMRFSLPYMYYDIVFNYEPGKKSESNEKVVKSIKKDRELFNALPDELNEMKKYANEVFDIIEKFRKEILEDKVNERRETHRISKIEKDFELKIEVGIDRMSNDEFLEFREDFKDIMVDSSDIIRGVELLKKIGIEYDDIKELDTNWVIKTSNRIICDKKIETTERGESPSVMEEIKENIKKELRRLKKENKEQFEAISGLITNINEEETIREICEKVSFFEELFVANLVSSMSSVEKEKIYRMKAKDLVKLYNKVKK
jgi:hypothetical protein